MTIIRPQAGMQEKALRSKADIVIAGGAAGSGKTQFTLMKPLVHKDVKGFGAEIFRRTMPQIKMTGGLWDKSYPMYSGFGAKPNSSELKWTFPSGVCFKFSGLQYEKDVYEYQGAEIPYILWEELTHFTSFMFWYMLSRNRSTCGVKPRMFGTCNPDPDSFVAPLVGNYINQETGYPIPEMSGVLQYMWKVDENIIWGSCKEEIYDNPAAREPIDLVARAGNTDPLNLIKSFTFIPGSIYENKKLLEADPGYLANLLAQDEETQARLLGGNWKIRTDASSLFQFESIRDLFSNKGVDQTGKYITCDVAGFGKDLCVIFAWQGWEVVGINVLSKTGPKDVIAGVDFMREMFNVPLSNTLLDQDGIGAETVRKYGCKGFSGGSAPLMVQGLKENYKNLKTQCAFYLAKKVNDAEVAINIDSASIFVDGFRSRKVKIGSKVWKIEDLIRDDLRAIKRISEDLEGKIQMNSKADQKIILGRSPDFFDTMNERAFFSIRPAMVYK